MTGRVLGPKLPSNAPIGARSGPAAAAAAGVSYRQLTYWTDAGYLHTLGERRPGSGTSRVYTPDEIRVARALGVISAALGRAGSLEHIAQALHDGTPCFEIVPGITIDMARLVGDVETAAS